MKLQTMNITLAGLIKSATILILLISVILFTGYVIKLKNEIRNHHKQVTNATINVMTVFYNQFHDIGGDNDIDQKTKDEITEMGNSFGAAFFTIGADSIAEIYEELTEDQQDVVLWARQNIIKVSNHE